MGNWLLPLVVLTSVGVLAVFVGCRKCGGPFALLVHIVDALLGGRPAS